MTYLSLDQLITIHEAVLGESPGERRIANAEALAYCILRPQIGSFPSLAGRVAALLEAIVIFQPFVDGNQRTAWVASRTFALLNQHRLRGTPTEVRTMLLRIRKREHSFVEVRAWVEDHLEHEGE